jgi:hypothetical protein
LSDCGDDRLRLCESCGEYADKLYPCQFEEENGESLCLMVCQRCYEEGGGDDRV